MEINRHSLRAIRELKGITVSALAAQAGIKQAHLSNVELGYRRASDEVIKALADSLGVDQLAITRDPVAA